MTAHAFLAQRVKKAKSTTVAIVEPGRVVVQGSKSEYTTMITRKGAEMRVTCADSDGCHCRGNYFNNTVCYHGMRAALELAKKAGYSVSFCANKNHADRLARLGGEVFVLKSTQSGGEVWMVATKSLSGWQQRQLEYIESAIENQARVIQEKPWSGLAKKIMVELQGQRDVLLAQS